VAARRGKKTSAAACLLRTHRARHGGSRQAALRGACASACRRLEEANMRRSEVRRAATRGVSIQRRHMKAPEVLRVKVAYSAYVG